MDGCAFICASVQPTDQPHKDFSVFVAVIYYMSHTTYMILLYVIYGDFLGFGGHC